MTDSELIEKIKSKGYWRISFEPKSAETKLQLKDCLDIVDKNSIHLRGWDYPHIPRRTGDDTAIETGENYKQAWLDWNEMHHKEFWRMYQSGQFIHYLALKEDWIQDLVQNNMWEREAKQIAEGGGLGITSTVYLLTEVYQFLSKLVSDGLYEKGIDISVSLNNTKNRGLFVDNFNRIPLSYQRKTNAPAIKYEQSYTKQEILTDPKELAFKAIVYIFERFSWDPPNVEVIKQDQENLLARKI